ncbi:hypothetical protein [Cellulomonas fengjieae]|uniref:Bacterial spore germination immunoglobulin-like domain-containing protein n=1 Tax=Cellulomonas fengjieae TaxID=2819978 RepID=A0ABS3SDK7_9CELL|nr:hypothetical protein [Cellulomonas fengjieae]MBO3083828.1 hypothetical protein [Cellulomonas fengjieae]
MTNRCRPRTLPARQSSRHVTGRWAVAAPAVVTLLLGAGCTAPEIDRGEPASPSPTASATSTPGGTAPSATAPVASPSTDPSTAPTVAPTSPPAGPPRTAVSVTTTYAGWSSADGMVLVGAYVDGVVESEGSCSLVLTGPGTTASVTTPAVPDAGSTSCGELRSPVGGPGTWTATVGYESPTSTGTADAITVVVP